MAASIGHTPYNHLPTGGLAADKPGSEEPHYHLQQEERIKVKQGKLGYFIGHQTHVQSAEAGDDEVIIKPG